MSAIFGVAGNSQTYTEKVSRSSLGAPGWLREIGLDAYEYPCGRGVRVGESTARAIGTNAAENGIVMSLHAPYFINLANPNPESQRRTIDYVLAACRAADWMGAGRVVVHVGARMNRTRREAMNVARQLLREVIRACDECGYGHIALCPETMGKINQLGDPEEVLELCSSDARLVPCIDFGHLYARTLGASDGEEATETILNRLEAVLGKERAGRFHCHFSHVEFTPKGGESRHIRFADGGWGPDFAPLAGALVRRDWSPTIICESAGSQSEDALEMKRIYQTYRKELCT